MKTISSTQLVLGALQILRLGFRPQALQILRRGLCARFSKILRLRFRARALQIPARSFCRLHFDQHLLDKQSHPHYESQKPKHEQVGAGDAEEAV